ncbi:hypothetical protein K469DRAFT_727769 [Zopfia rhizophila CBS 207.26]|uniref:MFS general substrate transporter n=1 Tax=Zopfia rhizophila CBS 207.26 TaxID=1314779 RepID=A0A6A6DX04_9PEZI|nr:hypothetical protein K469DRAFT_727769 [Zopfia rhizophila CBS 207.26]
MVATEEPKESSAGAVPSVAETTIDPENEVTGATLLLVHTGIYLCTFLVGFDSNLIATAVVVITSQFSSINDLAKSTLNSPKKITYLIYLSIFAAGTPIARRAVASFGASGVFAKGFMILTTIIPVHKRAIWTATMSSTFAIASIVGPVLGGSFTQHMTWRWCFYTNLPIGGFSAIIVLFYFRVRSAATEKAPLMEKLKGLGGVRFIIFAASITILPLALQRGGTSYAVMIPPWLFNAHGNVWLICASSFFVNGPFRTIGYWLPLWFRAVLWVSLTSSGIRYLPTVISNILALYIGAGILFGEAIVCLGAGLLTTLYLGLSDGRWIAYQIFGGMGYSLVDNLAHLGMQASLLIDVVPIKKTFITIIFISKAFFYKKLNSTFKVNVIIYVIIIFYILNYF